MNGDRVLIVGGGLAGLTCARHLTERGRSCLVLEADDQVGGRVRTDEFRGFRLDRGFQVLLSAYPECRRVLDYDALDLGRFLPGALVRIDGRFHRIGDPWRRPGDLLRTLLAPVGTPADKVRIGRLRHHLRGLSEGEVFRGPERTTAERLRSFGFSDRVIDRFFRPFFGGIFLERELTTSSRMFDFVFRMFSLGDACLPRGGMGRLPEQLAAGLPEGTVRLGARVERIDRNRVQLRGGEELEGAAVVIATDASDAVALDPGLSTPRWRSVRCLYFAADRAPVEEPILLLGDRKEGPIDSLAVLSQVAEGFAPPGQALISATVLEGSATNGSLLEDVRTQLQSWFGAPTARWEFLRSYEIERALPAQDPPALADPERTVRLRTGLYACGDHRSHASIEGAMSSGRRAAEAVLADLGGVQG